MFSDACPCVQHDGLPSAVQRRVPTVLLLLLVVLSAAGSAAEHSHSTAQFTPWSPRNWMQQARAASRSLLQNPDRPLNGFHGAMARMGSMKDYVPPGYPLEQHKVLTQDGWVLNAFRIPRGKQRHSEPGKRPVVLLIHGFSLSSLSFVLLNQNESIAYILADAGFDVWMMNTRSNDFSRGSLYYSHREAEYWYTSIDEMGLYDVPATVNYVLNNTRASKLSILTHSQGGTLVYMMMVDLPHMQEKVASLIAMGPPVFMEYMQAPFLRTWANSRNDKFFFEPSAIGEFLQSRMLWPFTKQCRDWNLLGVCAHPFMWNMFYGPSSAISVDDVWLILNTWPATVASRTMTHWAQMVKDKRLRLQHFDYGTDCSNLTRYRETCNQQKYGTLEPPEYDLSTIRVPVFIMQASMDVMVAEEDTAEQARRIPTATRIHYDEWSHMDYTWDRNARHAVDVVDIFFRYSPGTF